MRVIQHIIDTKAVKKVLAAFPDEWVIRELSERDYGIDLMVEIFEQIGKDDHNHNQYDTTGYTAYLQIKGTGEELKFSNKKSESCSVTRKHLMYVEKFPIPFFLLKVSTFTEGEIYFVWLQRYISDVLDVEDPSWRSSKKDKILIKIPKHNKLSDKINKIIRIASKIKYVEELAEFLERINKINYDIKSGAIIDEKVCDSNIASLRRIKRLKTLLKYNNSSISSTSVDNLINHVIDIKTRNDDFEDLLNDEDNFNFNQLYKEITNLQFVENFEAENHFDTSY